MKNSTKLAGAAGATVVACAACCAVSIVPTVLAGSSLIALGAASYAWGLVAIAIAMPLAGAYLYLRRKRQQSNRLIPLPTKASSCGCGPSKPVQMKPAPIACTLDTGEMKSRTDQMRSLAMGKLRRVSRDGLSIHLVYAPDALKEVQELVVKEEVCCSFLTFRLTHDVTGVYLSITASEEAAGSASVLFEQYAPVELEGRK